MLTKLAQSAVKPKFSLIEAAGLGLSVSFSIQSGSIDLVALIIGCTATGLVAATLELIAEKQN